MYARRLSLTFLLPLLITGCKSSPSSSGTTSGDLSKLSSGDKALEQKIDPVITCLNRALTHFDELAPAYRQRMKDITNPSTAQSAGSVVSPTYTIFVTFKVEPYEQNGEFSTECAKGLNQAAAQSPSDPGIDAPAKDAAQALVALIAPGAQMDAYLDQKAYLDDNAARGRQLDETISPLLTRIVADSHQLRASVVRTKATLVQHELDAIEKKDGRNLDWHTRQTMQAASVANEQVQDQASSGQLSAASVGAAMQPLQAAVDDTQSFLAKNPAIGKGGPNQVQPVWFSLTGSFSSQLGQMRELRSSITDPTTSGATRRSIVNGHLQAVNMSYNGAVQSYNTIRAIGQ